ncbi:MAG: hypothetical protein WKF76_03575 [Nocardioidaceae bacterium]
MSWADVGWLAYYPFTYVAILLLVRARVRRFRASTALDGLLAGLAAAAVVATVVFGGLAAVSGQSTLVLVVTVAYPVADLLLIVLVVGFFAVTGSRPDRSWLILGAGLHHAGHRRCGVPVPDCPPAPTSRPPGSTGCGSPPSRLTAAAAWVTHGRAPGQGA